MSTRVDRVEVLVVGAGVSGLACAERLHRAGLEVVLLDRGRRPGGRCASRRIGDAVFDHGPVFVHGREDGFLEWVRRAGAAGGLAAWPAVTEGAGTPCNVEAVGLGVQRFALTGGVNQLPVRLAEGLQVRSEANVERISSHEGELRVEGDGWSLASRELVLALPPPQALPLLRGLSGTSVASVMALLELVPYVASLSLALRYPADHPAPSFDLCLPADVRSPVQLISHESSKRPTAGSRVFVLQGRPAWSRARLELGAELWSEELRRAAVPYDPAFAAPPLEQYAHRWRYARMAGPGLSGPLSVELAGGARLSFAGEAFDPGGGLEGAWRSGRRLADRILAQGGES